MNVKAPRLMFIEETCIMPIDKKIDTLSAGSILDTRSNDYLPCEFHRVAMLTRSAML